MLSKDLSLSSEQSFRKSNSSCGLDKLWLTPKKQKGILGIHGNDGICTKWLNIWFMKVLNVEYIR